MVKVSFGRPCHVPPCLINEEGGSICFVIWLCYHSKLALHDRPMLAMVNILALELCQLLQYSYDCSSVMSVLPKGGGSARALEYPLLV